MINYIIIGIILIILVSASIYIYKEKKSGKKCIGCPESCSCTIKGEKSCCGCCDVEEN